MIELLVVMAILAILAAAVMPLGETMVRAQRERELRRALTEIRDALDAYKRAADAGLVPVNRGESGYPPSLQILVEGVADQRPGSTGQRRYFLRRIPRDPFADPALPAELTWRLRSYASPPDKPAEGVDIFDVLSSSSGIGIDGTPHASW